MHLYDLAGIRCRNALTLFVTKFNFVTYWIDELTHGNSCTFAVANELFILVKVLLVHLHMAHWNKNKVTWHTSHMTWTTLSHDITFNILYMTWTFCSQQDFQFCFAAGLMSEMHINNISTRLGHVDRNNPQVARPTKKLTFWFFTHAVISNAKYELWTKYVFGMCLGIQVPRWSCKS